MSARQLCINGRHPWKPVYSSNRLKCYPCYQARMGAGRRLGRWSMPQLDPQRAAKFNQWASGLHAAIDTIRREQGFDGRERPWRTLGDAS